MSVITVSPTIGYTFAQFVGVDVGVPLVPLNFFSARFVIVQGGELEVVTYLPDIAALSQVLQLVFLISHL